MNMGSLLAPLAWDNCPLGSAHVNNRELACSPVFSSAVMVTVSGRIGPPKQFPHELWLGWDKKLPFIFLSYIFKLSMYFMFLIQRFLYLKSLGSINCSLVSALFQYGYIAFLCILYFSLGVHM